MMNSNPFFIRFLFPLGWPGGPQIIDKTGWFGKGIIFSRPVFDKIRNLDALNDQPNPLKAPGVYILWEPEEESPLPLVYIGESEDPSTRICNHNRDKNKEFWTRAVVFSGSGRLNKAHIQYLEARLVILAEEAKRCNRGASNTPQKPQLGEADKMTADDFLRNMLLCLSIVRVDFFEKPRVPSKTPQTSKSVSTEDQTSTPITQRELFLTVSNGVNARGYYSGSEFVVLEGSKSSKTQKQSLLPIWGKIREVLLQKGVWKDDGETFVFTQDYAFNSPSRASSVCLGRSSNGWREWKDKNNRSLKDLLKGL